MTSEQRFDIVDLATPRGSESLGKKAANLAQVATIEGARTPKGFALSGEVVGTYLAPFRPMIADTLATVDSGRAHARIEHSMMEDPLDFGGQLVDHLSQHFERGALFAVRSSAHPIVKGVAVSEDSDVVSLAGQFSSFLRVPRHKVPEAVSRCVASLFNPRSIDLFRPQEDRTYIGSTMTVVIQEMIEATASGVMMTMDPISHGEGSEVVGIEASYGACEAIVAGRTQGDLFLVDRASHEVLETEIGSKRWRSDLPIYGDAPTDNHDDLIPVPAKLASAQALDNEEVQRISRLGLAIEARFGSPQDIEFVLDANRDVVITQARPITTLKGSNS